MTPAARVQAAIDLLDRIVDAASTRGAPADRLIAGYFRERRYAGGGDRRAVRELVFAAIRACGPRPESGRAAMLRLAQLRPDLLALFDGSPHAPAPRMPDEPVAAGGTAPPWLVERLARSGVGEAEQEALLGRAPLDLRVNTLKSDRDALLPLLPVPVELLPLPQALRVESGINVTQWAAYRDGLIEVQDLGSQIACLAAAARPGMTVIDLCAGAGGKTLALAAAMENTGSLVASDTDRRRLGELRARAERAGVSCVAPVLLDPGREDEALAPWRGRADLVLVDAPCSGTGTWRRNPELRWRLTPAELSRLAALQTRLIGLGAELLRPGGRLVFVTCSLFDEEGADQAAKAADRLPLHPAALALPFGHARGRGVRLSPLRDGTDGFFIAGFEKP
ncbi:RsmB/NOP family class I SAM-dependent RNA methyltransferase [Erythrobacteraceae bacterium CFH 75059]|uniref:RsmB/NOP family class I SAM-dependent RNA methyltransferase n=1 Tax=Qipengyuania thermophila TaxID=2509361 RepID=UPI001020E9C6|nr:RsmB/NOP family class I SAM-dependent RNA methyltransferase [Qipengyuania thermophila]TCD05346.1 RsmB/NOP family class I SAM-dependent RNA methyltransferase [Erythrobacteraceae bacterium CFH 75059]